MKLHILNLLTILFLQGCASFTAHEGTYMSDGGGDLPTYIYGGVVTDFQWIGRCITAPVNAQEATEENGYEDIQWWEILLTPLPIIDIPFSLILDTIYLPHDISNWSKEE